MHRGWKTPYHGHNDSDCIGDQMLVYLQCKKHGAHQNLVSRSEQPEEHAVNGLPLALTLQGAMIDLELTVVVLVICVLLQGMGAQGAATAR